AVRFHHDDRNLAVVLLDDQDRLGRPRVVDVVVEEGDRFEQCHGEGVDYFVGRWFGRRCGFLRGHDSPCEISAAYSTLLRAAAKRWSEAGRSRSGCSLCSHRPVKPRRIAATLSSHIIALPYRVRQGWKIAQPGREMMSSPLQLRNGKF